MNIVMQVCFQQNP